MGNNFRKVRDGGKLRQQRVEQRQTVLPDASIRRVHQHLVEKQVDFRAQARDRLFNRLTRDAPVLVVEVALGTRLEQGFVNRSATLELRLLQDVADTLE